MEDYLCFGEKVGVVKTLEQGSGLLIIIPAARQGKRMKNQGPKCLLELTDNGETVLSRQISILKGRFPFAQIAVITGFEANAVYRALQYENIHVLENQSHETTHVVKSIDIGLRAFPANHVLIVYGDLVFNSCLFDDVDLSRSWALTDTPREGGVTWMNSLEVGLNVLEGKIATFAYGFPTKWGQIVYLTSHELALFRKQAAHTINHRYYAHELLNVVIDKGGEIHPFEPNNMRLGEIDVPKDLDKVRKTVLLQTER